MYYSLLLLLFMIFPFIVDPFDHNVIEYFRILFFRSCVASCSNLRYSPTIAFVVRFFQRFYYLDHDQSTRAREIIFITNRPECHVKLFRITKNSNVTKRRIRE